MQKSPSDYYHRDFRRNFIPIYFFVRQENIAYIAFAVLITQMALCRNLTLSFRVRDGVTSKEPSPSHTYPADGTYSITLSMTATSENCPMIQLTQTHPLVIDNKKVCVGVYCDGDGRVGIGAQSFAAGHTLAIKGKTIAEGAQVMSHLKWPDFVFGSDYQLMPLNELKNDVTRYRYLPETPSEKDVKKDGVDVEKMSILLLKKTEELTLYLIQLDARLKELEKTK